jgi:hypothetical protein
VIRAPVSRGQLRAEVERRLPFDAEIAICVPATTRNWNTITAIRKVLDAGANLLVKNELAAGAASDPRRSHLPDRLDGDLAHQRDTADAGCRKEEAFEAPGGARLSCASVREAGDVYTV